MNPIYFDSKRITKTAIKLYKKTLKKLRDRPSARGLHFEKLNGADNVYSIRDNQKARLLFTIREIGGKPSYVILEILEKHQYQRSQYLRGLLAADDIGDDAFETFSLADVDLIPEASAASDDKQPLHLQQLNISIYNQQLIILTDAQQNILKGRLPLALQGGPGTGKTCLAAEILNQTLDQAKANGEGHKKILYLAKSPKLVSRFQAQFNRLEHSHLLEFHSYQTLVTRLLPEAAAMTFVDKIEFSQFAKAYLHQKRRKPVTDIDIDMLYQELRIISGFATKEAYFQLGQRQCLFDVTERAEVWSLYQDYQHYLTSENKIDCSLLPLLDRTASAQYDVIVVDEAQDLSFGQLLTLTKLAKDKQVCFLLDANQRLFDIVSHANYLRTILQIPLHSLTQSFRCPKKIVALANSVLNYKKHFPSLLRGKVESQTTISGLDEDGELRWLSMPSSPDEPLPDNIRQLAGTPELAVITAKDYKSEARTLLNTPLIFTPAEIKGLEYPYIVLHRPFDSAPYAQINKLLANKKSTSRSISPTAIEQALKETFVSCTRAQKGLVIINNSHHRNRSLLEQLQDRHSSSLSAATHHQPMAEVDQTQWYTEIARLYNNGKDDQALNAVQQHIQDHQAFQAWLMANHQQRVNQWLSSQTDDRHLQALYRPNSKQPVKQSTVPKASTTSVTFFNQEKAAPPATLSAQPAAAVAELISTTSEDDAPVVVVKDLAALADVPLLPLATSATTFDEQALLSAENKADVIKAIRQLITPALTDKTLTQEIYLALFKIATAYDETLFEKLATTKSFDLFFTLLKKSCQNTHQQASQKKKRRGKKGKHKKSQPKHKSTSNKLLFNNQEQAINDKRLMIRPYSVAALLLSGLYHTANKAFKVLKMQRPLLAGFQGYHLRNSVSINQLAELIDESRLDSPIDHASTYFYGLLCEQGCHAIYKSLAKLDKLDSETISLLSQEAHVGEALGDFALNIVMRQPETREAILKQPLLAKKLLCQPALSQLSNHDEVEGSSPLLWLLQHNLGHPFFRKNYNELLPYISSKAFNQSINQGFFADISPLYLLTRDPNSCHFMLTRKRQKTLKKLMTLEGLNRSISTESKEREMTPLYHLSRQQEGAHFIIDNWPYIKEKATLQTLHHIKSNDIAVGTSPLYWLAEVTGGPRLIIDNWQYLSEGAPNGVSPLYWLLASPNGQNFFIEHWHEIKTFITKEMLNQPILSGMFEGASPLFWLFNTERGQKFFLENFRDLQHIITTEGLHCIVQAAGQHQGTSPLYWLSENVTGVTFILENWDYFNQSSSNGTNLLYWLTANPKSRDFVMVNWPTLKESITTPALYQMVESGTRQSCSALYWLADSPEGCQFLVDNWHDFNGGHSQGLGVLYWLTANLNGQRFLINNWHAIAQYTTPAMLNQPVVEGQLAGITPLFWLADSPEGREFIINNWHELKDFIEPQTFNRPIKSGLHEGASPLYWFAETDTSCRFIIDNWDYLERGAIDGAGPLFWLSANPDGRDFIMNHWQQLQAHLTAEEFNRPILDGSLKGQSPLFWFTICDGGRAFLTKHFASISPLITAEGLNQVCCYGDFQNVNPLHRLLSCSETRPILVENFLAIKDKITKEGLNQVACKGAFAQISPLCWLLTYDEGREVFFEHWPDFKKLILLSGLNRVIQEGEHKGKSALFWLLADNAGRQFLMDHWHEFKHLITKRAFNQAACQGVAAGISPLFQMASHPNSCQFLSDKWLDFNQLVTKQGLKQSARHGRHQGKCPLDLLAQYPHITGLRFFDATGRQVTRATTMEPIPSLKL